MALSRTILALLIAASVALLPAVGGAAFDSTTHDAAEMSATGPMHDCCPPAANPCDMGDCGSMAACALKCFSFVGGMSSPLDHLALLAGPMPLFGSGPFYARASIPPFRPPRI